MGPQLEALAPVRRLRKAVHSRAALLALLASAFAAAQSAPPSEAAAPQQHVCTDISRTEVVPCPGDRSGSAAQQVATSQMLQPAAASSKTSSALAADAPPDANFIGTADAAVHRTGLRDLPLNFLQDQRNFFF